MESVDSFRFAFLLPCQEEFSSSVILLIIPFGPGKSQLLSVQLYKAMQVAWPSAATPSLSMASVVLPALVGACQQLLLTTDMFKVILAYQDWYFLCFYSLFSEAVRVNSAAGELEECESEQSVS